MVRSVSSAERPYITLPCAGHWGVCVYFSPGARVVENGGLTGEHRGPHANGHQLGASNAKPAEGTDRVADANEAMQTDDGQEKNGACRHRWGVNTAVACIQPVVPHDGT